MKDLDLSLFEGHTPEPWVQSSTGDGELYVVRDADGAIIIALSSAWRGAEPTTRLAAAAPALLAEVKRLRGELDRFRRDQPQLALDAAAFRADRAALAEALQGAADELARLRHLHYGDSGEMPEIKAALARVGRVPHA